jgi:4,5:9,10-diseco-3-hydroxy-5,9,17-trioxoandrosta-1(10),2-diene-4-oate hydrolase
MTHPQSRYAEIDGIRIHYRDLGEGEPVVFLHGGGPGASSWSNFKATQQRFVAEGFRALLPDTVGFGRSDKPADRDYSFDFLNACLLGALDEAGVGKAVFVGNSMGGAMAIKLALDHPDRVSKLILLAPAGLASRERYGQMPGIRAIAMAALGEDGPTPQRLRETFALQLFDKSLITEALIAERHEIAVTQPKAVYLTMRIPDLSGDVARLACPVLTFWGMNDEFCPVETAQLLATGPEDSRVVLVNRCGHWVQVERPGLFESVSIAFLRNAL